MRPLIALLVCVAHFAFPLPAVGKDRDAAAEFVDSLLGPWFPNAWKVLRDGHPYLNVDWGGLRKGSGESALKDELAALWRQRCEAADIESLAEYLKAGDGLGLLREFYDLAGKRDNPGDFSRLGRMNALREAAYVGLRSAVRDAARDSLDVTLGDTVVRISKWGDDQMARVTSPTGSITRGTRGGPAPFNAPPFPFLVPVVLDSVRAGSGGEGVERGKSPILHIPPGPVKLVPPGFPKPARTVSTEVIVEVTIDERGKVTDARVIQVTPPGPSDEVRPYEDAAQAAARQWEFTPARSNGVPVQCRISLPFEFGAWEN